MCVLARAHVCACMYAYMYACACAKFLSIYFIVPLTLLINLKHVRFKDGKKKKNIGDLYEAFGRFRNIFKYYK